MSTKDTENPANIYLSLMTSVRKRLDFIESIKSASQDSFANCETAAFQGRKVVESIAFGCLVAVENGLKHIPKDAKGQWNAEEIFKRLLKKNIHSFPNPSFLRDPTKEEFETTKSKFVVQGIPEQCLTYEEIIDIYQNLHKWLHELNPYTIDKHSAFLTAHKDQLWINLSRLSALIERHVIIISNAGFYCTLRDNVDGQTKVFAFASLED